MTRLNVYRSAQLSALSRPEPDRRSTQRPPRKGRSAFVMTKAGFGRTAVAIDDAFKRETLEKQM